MTNPMQAPSPLTDSAVRKLARRRGYKLHKLRGKDRYWLQDLSQDPPHGKVLAQEHCENTDDCYFTKYSVVEYLREEPQ